MDKMPKRRKSKDNPYILSKDEKNNIYLVSFVDGTNTYRSIKITKEVYQAMDCFERQDLKEMNEYDRHTEHSEVYENNLNRRKMKKNISLEDEIILNTTLENLKIAINKLPKIQKRRIIKYYFEEKSEVQIAEEENSTQQAINYSLKCAKNNLKKFF